jgi:RND family efflux transporter MFP subunit
MNYRFCFTGMVVLSVMLMASCGDKKPPQQPAPQAVPISVYHVNEGSATYYDQYPGTVTALDEVELRPQVAGYITAIHFKDGQHVTKGMKLYTIDQQQYKANYNQAVANLNVSKANLARVQQDADRYNELAKKDAIAKQTLDHALADLESTKMQVAASEANVANVKSTLGFSVISSPMTGTIGISQVKLGAAVAPGQTILNTVSSDNPLAIDFAVDEKEIPRFVQLQQKGGKAIDSTFQILLPDQSLYSEPGHISVIDRAVDPQTGTIKIRDIFPNSKGLLKPGMSCIVRVRNNGNINKILIPYKAVMEQMGEYFVYVVHDSIVTQAKVKLGTRINENIIVNDGLKLDEIIATEGIQKLRDSAKVKISNEPATQLKGK